MQDPTDKEMRDHIAIAFAGLMDPHDYRPGPMTDGPEPGSQSAMIYSELESEFGIGGRS